VVTLPAIKGDTTSPPGDLVGDLLGTAVTDVDSGSVSGIAIVGLTSATNGVWQYTLNNGSTWMGMGTVSASLALLLPNTGVNSRIRFVPNTNFNGMLTVGVSRLGPHNGSDWRSCKPVADDIVGRYNGI